MRRLVLGAFVAACGARTELYVSTSDAATFDGSPIDAAPSPLLSVADIHACVRSSSGVLSCWGASPNGELAPDGGFVSLLTPQVVATHAPPLAVTSNDTGNCILDATGTVSCWGWDDAFKRLGDGTAIPQPPPGVLIISGAVALVGATNFTNQCARMNDGSVECWGYTPMCDPTIADAGVYHYKTTPAARPDLQPIFTTLSLGQQFACGVLDGVVQCCGKLLGDGTVPSAEDIGYRATLGPAAVQGLAADVATSPALDACARMVDGTAQCWGWNNDGQIGDGTIADKWSPAPVVGLTDVAQLALGVYHTCARLTDGTARCWGDNTHGELGDGTLAQHLTPVAVRAPSGSGLLSDVVDLHAGYDFTCALLSSGDVYCWGWNDYGQIGDGTTTDRHLPTKVIGLP